jgi:hypothetical protein
MTLLDEVLGSEELEGKKEDGLEEGDFDESGEYGDDENLIPELGSDVASLDDQY